MTLHHCTRGFLLFIACVITPLALAQSTNWILGLNWATMNRFLNDGKMHTLFDSTVGCNLYHGAENFDDWSTSRRDHGAIGWAQNSVGKLVFGYYGHYLYEYSGAERIEYEAAPNSMMTADSIAHFHFDSVAGGVYIDPSTHSRYVEMDSSVVGHTDSVFLSRNEFPCEWRDDGATQFTIAVKMQVASLYAGSTDPALTVRVKQYHSSNGTYTTCTTFDIPRNVFATANVDQIAFSPTFTLGSQFVRTRDSLLVEVSSKRYVTARIAWVIVEDSRAKDLMTYYDVDPADPSYGTWSTLHSAIRDSIRHDTSVIHTTLGNNNPRWYFLHDEPPVSEYACAGEVNAIINHRGITEGGTEFAARFLTMVQPRIFWNAIGAGGQVCSYLDSALEGNTPVTKDSCGGTCFQVGTLRSHVADLYGYFPAKPGTSTLLQPDSVYATDTTYATTGNGVQDGYSFDIYDYRQGAFPVTRLFGAWNVGMWADSAVFLAPPDTAHRSWIANIFGTGHVMSGYDTAGDTISRMYGGYYDYRAPATGEELEALCGTAIAQGAHGLVFYTGTTLPWADAVDTLPSSYCLNVGFVSDSGTWASDSGTYQVSLPTLFKRNTNWLIRYGRWFNHSASELKTMKWAGAFTRIGMEDSANPAHIIKYEKAIGTNSLVVPDSDVVTRPVYAHWPRAGVPDTILQVRLPDSLRWVTYGFYVNPADTLVRYAVIQNNFCDGRNLSCHWLWNADSACLRRGSRTLSCRLLLDTNQSTYFRATLLDSTHWDTILAARNPRLVVNLGPGQTRIFRIEPFCGYADRNAIDTLGVAYNNAVHMVKHGDDGYRYVYVHNQSVCTRKATDCALFAEQVVDTGGIRDTLLAAGIACPRTYGVTAIPPVDWGGPPEIQTIADYWKCDVVDRTPCIAQHRGTAAGATDEDLIVWEQNVFRIPYHDGQPDGRYYYGKFIMARPISFIGDTFALGNPFVVGDTSEVTQDSSFWCTPSVTSCDSGWVIAYADSARGIRVMAIAGHNGSYWHSSPDTLILNGLHGAKRPAKFPSIAYGQDLCTNCCVGSPTCYVPQVHVAWQQPDSLGKSQIWHQPVEVRFQGGQCPYLGTDPSFPCELVSSIADLWNCDNTMPSISVPAWAPYRNFLQPNAMDLSHIIWHADILNDSLQHDRVLYRIWAGVPNWWGPRGAYQAAYASGAEGYLEPHVYVSPSDTMMDQTLLFTWYDTNDTLHAYVPGDTILRQYGVRGRNTTFSYDLGMDFSPSTMFAMADSVPDIGVQKVPGMSNSALAFTPRSGIANSITVRGKPFTYASCSSCCAYRGIWLTIGYSTGSNYPFLAPIQMVPSSPYSGNGTVENTAVKTAPFVMQAGLPVTVRRRFIAKDAGQLAYLTANTPAFGKLELIDSSTNAVLAVIDSFNVTGPADSIDNESDVIYTPDINFVGFPVFIRARIIADTSRAHWDVASTTEFGYDTTGWHLQKAAFRYAGRAGWVPAGDNPINMSVYPNPFNPRTRVMYTVPVDDAGDITEIKVYNSLMQDVSTLVHDVKPEGRYAVEFDARDLPSGRYFVAVRMATHSQSKLIVLTR